VPAITCCGIDVVIEGCIDYRKQTPEARWRLHASDGWTTRTFAATSADHQSTINAEQFNDTMIVSGEILENTFSLQEITVRATAYRSRFCHSHPDI